MKSVDASRKVGAKHGVVCSFPNEFFGYFGWPSVTRMQNGDLVVAASGLRNAHVCPFGRSIVCRSSDDGETWTTPTVVNDFPLDDRDTGILALGEGRLLISWFSNDTRRASIYSTYEGKGDPEFVQRYQDGFRRMTDANAARWVGSWVRLSSDGGERWEEPVKVPVTAPHGPIQLRDGTLLYFGKSFLTDTTGHRQGRGEILAVRSADEGRTWQQLGTVPMYGGTAEGNYHEPHCVELADGKLVGLIRVQNHDGAPKLEDLGLVSFAVMQTESSDGGRTWTQAQPLGFHGSPPHVIRHSSGTLVCVYGYRQKPYGERAMLSRDGGQTWQYHYVLRDDGSDGDLGYPASVELGDGSILTIYYQKISSRAEKCSVLWSRWELPE